MGLFSSFFSKKTLLQSVKKINKSLHGAFNDAMNDLASYIEGAGDNEDPMRLMAYAYARRHLALGLYLQCIFNKQDYEYQLLVFKGFQLKTGHSKQFQIDAHEQALKFIASYDSRLTREFLVAMSLFNENHSFPKFEPGVYIKYDAIIFTINKMVDDGEIVVPINIEEIQKTGSTDLKSEASAAKTSWVTNGLAVEINSRIKSKDIAFQFVMEELDAAKYGNDIAQKFVKESGFIPEEFTGAMSRSCPEVEELQQLFLAVLMMTENMDARVSQRIEIVKYIINYWELNDYSEQRIDKILLTLKNALIYDDSVMPALTRNIPTPNTAYPRHINNRKINIETAEKSLNILIMMTNLEKDELIKQALEM